MTNWKELIQEELEQQKEMFSDVIKNTLSDEDLEIKFHDGYGGSEGKPFTMWTTNRVYFPIVYDGSEWVGSAPRNPCEEAVCHLGGE